MSKIKKLNFKIAKSDSAPTGHVTVEWVGTMVMGMSQSQLTNTSITSHKVN